MAHPVKCDILRVQGGGYDFCSDREAEPIALTYLHAGYQAFILRYSRMENKKWPAPLMDYEEAITMIRSRAEEWGVIPDKIAVIGFSAGGHLAASAATMSVNRPNAAILVYAVLDEESAKEWNETAPDAVAAVDEKTCPCFLAASRTDTMVPADNTIRSIGQVLATEEGRALFAALMGGQQGGGGAQGDINIKQSVMNRFKVSDLLGFSSIPEEVLGQIEAQLKAIKV